MTVYILSKRRDVLGRYYTSDPVSALLVRAMKLDSAETVLDLGSGAGALAAHASAQWPSACFHTVDIDENAGCRRLAELDGATFRHHVGDALDYRLPSRIGVAPGSVCAAVCNPPYIRPRWQRHYGQILEEAGLSDILPRLADAPADLLFIAQNLRFLRPGGKLGLIVPDGLISGERFKAFRSRLLQGHCVNEVIELPVSIFRYTEAKAHILVLSKESPPTEVTAIRRLDADGQLSRAIKVPREMGEYRLDYSHNATQQRLPARSKGTAELRTLVTSIARGTYSSSDRQAVRAPIVHTTDLTAGMGNLPPTLALGERQVGTMLGPIAQPGDIIVARVGRNLHEKVTRVTQGRYAVSDCLFIIRPMPGQAKRIYTYLRSAEGREHLAASAHGVGARFITVSALGRLGVPA